jgi:transposase InsO family protein
MPEETVENAAMVIGMFPHMGGCKGQAYMLYHKLGDIGMKAYDRIKVNVKRLVGQEAARRKLLVDRGAYEHVRPEKVGEIWAEDFTDLSVEGSTFKLALVLDTLDQYYVGWAVDSRATAALVGHPVEQALEENGGAGPKKFLLSDNGTQYISSKHERLLSSAEILQRRIPACVPQYDGVVEGGIREFKSVFYNVWERKKREEANEGRSLIERVRSTVATTALFLNEGIPRPPLGGVTPADVHYGTREAKQTEITQYQHTEESRRDIPPWSRSHWGILSSGLQADRMSDGELLTKLAFFCRRPLRRIARRNRECVG